MRPVLRRESLFPAEEVLFLGILFLFALTRIFLLHINILRPGFVCMRLQWYCPIEHPHLQSRNHQHNNLPNMARMLHGNPLWRNAIPEAIQQQTLQVRDTD